MKTYLFDSDVLIDYFNQQEKAFRLIEKISHIGSMSISVISITELRAGWDSEKSKIYLPKLHDIFPCSLVTKEIAEYAGELRKRLSQKGKALSTTDALIAATSIVNDNILVTRNRKDFPIPELSLYPKPY